MPGNKYTPQLVILPEDQAYATLARGFRNNPYIQAGKIHIMGVCRGWKKTSLELYVKYKKRLNENPQMHILLLIDFDRRAGRREQILSKMPQELIDRVYIIGCYNEVEKFKKELRHGKTEDFGYQLAQYCTGHGDDEAKNPWASKQLKENYREIARLKNNLGEVIFKKQWRSFK